MTSFNIVHESHISKSYDYLYAVVDVIAKLKERGTDHFILIQLLSDLGVSIVDFLDLPDLAEEQYIEIKKLMTTPYLERKYHESL